MIAGCTNSATDAAAPLRRRGRAPIGFAAALVAAAAAFAADPPPAGKPATAPAPASKAPPAARRLSAAELQKRFEKIQKGLDKAQDATDGTDAGRVSLLLQRADELIVEFQAGSGLDAAIAALAGSRTAAAHGDFGAARDGLRRGRENLRPLSDYSVARPLEIAYRSADQALEDQNPQEFAAAVDRLEATVLPGYLNARLADARAAVARGRQAMVRRDMKTGRKEVDAARVALGRLDYASALSQARYACIVGAELAQANAYLVAREQLQDGLRQMARALRRAPEADVEPLNQAQAAVTEVWRRLSKPQPGDSEMVSKAADGIETLRQRLR
ncbi:MAG TPA: hypothetical protein VMQ62_02655 [Dongiaceae bacterium]|nr:hypothetical protein [Dongiaceae bacterium]